MAQSFRRFGNLPRLRTVLLWRSARRTVHQTTPCYQVKKLSFPELDWDFLLDDTNKSFIDKSIKERKGVGDIDFVHTINDQLKCCEDNNLRSEFKQKLVEEGANIPNFSHPDSPRGDDSKILYTIGEQQKFNFTPKSVVELGESLNVLRTKDVNLATGNKTYYFIDKLAKLEHALVQFTLTKLLKNGFVLVSVPDLLNPAIVEACGFKTSGTVAQVYHLDKTLHPPLCLSGTAELAIGGMHVNKVLELDELPKKYVTVSRCYRAETSDIEHERGIYRVHQFTKVEMYGITANEVGTESSSLFEDFISIQNDIFTSLGLHYQVLDMATHELGAPAYRKYDVEAWMPAKSFYGEISSASNCTDYQSRRLHIKYRDLNGTLKHVHTVNGTACAIPRLVMALVENGQTESGHVKIPEVLIPYTKFDIIDHYPVEVLSLQKKNY